jgi:DNA polymerase I-like protein with 3'-5' exonuclease and polymerase domains
MALQPDGYTPTPEAGRDGQQGYLFHSPVRPDETPSFVVFPDTPEKPGGFFDRGTGQSGNLYDLLMLLNQRGALPEDATPERPSSNGHVATQVRRAQSLAEFCQQRHLDQEILERVWGVRQIVDEKSRRPMLEYPTPCGIAKRKALDGAKPKYTWAQRGGHAGLYGMDQAARRPVQERHTLYVVGGEVDVWACHAAGIPAICFLTGEGTPPHEDLVGELRGTMNLLGFRQARVIYNYGEAHDAPGKGSRAVAAALRAGRIAASAYGLPADLGKGGDIDDLHQRVGAGLLDALLALPELTGDGPSGLVVVWMDELLDEEFPEEDWTIDGLAQAGGTSLTAAKPKTGKSVFARNAAYHVAAGKDFLGRKVTQGKVLYFSFEDKKREVQGHFERMGARGLPIAFHFGEKPQDLLNKTLTFITEHGIVLAVLDPLFHAFDFKSDKDYAEVVSKMKLVVELARKTGVHVMITHHDGKLERDDGDAVLGSTGFFAAVDSLLTMHRRKEGRTLSTRLRSMTREDMDERVVVLDKETGLISLGGSIEQARSERATAEVMKAVGNQARTMADITDAIEMDDGVIEKTVKALYGEGKLARFGPGKPHHPYYFYVPGQYTPSAEELASSGDKMPIDMLTKRPISETPQDPKAEKQTSQQGVTGVSAEDLERWALLVAHWWEQVGPAEVSAQQVLAWALELETLPFTPEQSARARQTALGVWLKNRAERGDVLYGCRIVNKGKDRTKGSLWSLEQVDEGEGGPSPDPAPQDPKAEKQTSRQGVTGVTGGEGVTAGPVSPGTDASPGAPEGPLACDTSGRDTSEKSALPIYSESRVEEVSRGGVTGAAGPVSPVAEGGCDTSGPRDTLSAFLLYGFAQGRDTSSACRPYDLTEFGAQHLARASEVDSALVGPATEPVRGAWPGYKTGPLWSESFTLPAERVPWPLDPEKAPKIEPGDPRQVVVLREPQDMVDALRGYSGLVGIDIEADGADTQAPLLCLQLAIHPPDQDPLLMVLHHSAMQQDGRTVVPEALVAQLRRPELTPVWHNGGTYDSIILARHGCYLLDQPALDTFVCERVLLCGQFQDEDDAGWYPSAGFGEAVLRRLQIHLPQKKEQQKQIVAWAKEPELCPEALRYCAQDALYLCALFTAQWRSATERQQHALRLECEMQQMLTIIPYRGLAVDLERMAQVRSEHLAKMAEPEAQVRALLPGVKTGDKGRLTNHSLAKEIEATYGVDPASHVYTVRNNRKREREGKAPQAPHIWVKEEVRTEVRMEQYAWKEVADPLDAYMRAGSIADRMTPAYWRVREGRCYPVITSPGTRTMRMTGHHPNSQQVPADHRDVVLADPGEVIVSADLSQIEVRVNAVLAQDEKLMALTAEGDTYNNITAENYGLREEEVKEHPELRKSTKIVVLAVQYCGGPKVVRTQMLAHGKHCPDEEARALIEGYLDRYPGVRQMVEKARQLEKSCKEQKLSLAVGLPSGYYRIFRYHAQRQHNELLHTRFIPTRVSGLAACGFKVALGLLRDQGWGERLFMVLHDEISLRCTEEEVPEAKRVLVECLIKGLERVYPGLGARVGEPVVGRTWSKKGDAEVVPESLITVYEENDDVE